METDSYALRQKNYPIINHWIRGENISRGEFYDHLEIVIASPIDRSILWLVSRTCLEPENSNEFEEVCQEGFYKEFLATKTFYRYHQQVSYSDFFRQPSYTRPHSVRAYKIGVEFSRRCQKLGLLFPVVNRTKNVSDMTTFNYNLIEDLRYVRTVDLETLYHRTGLQVQGDCEMRMAWKFNDLKPRYYYCIGGTPYWKSRYIRRIAISLMESIPSTYMKIRTNPDFHLSNNPDTDYITTWDFTSFTTSLQELKHFVWTIARVLERDHVTLRLFDYRNGLVECMAHTLLDEYNESVNMGDRFSIHRLIDRLDLSLEDEAEHIQMNSGMLGVAGNIGLSTALHGLVVSRECGDHRSVCVGDDALAITENDPTESIIKLLKPLGNIHPEKFGIISPGQQDGYIKFLKRRFTRHGTSFVMSVLLNLPPLPYIDGVVGQRTQPINFSYMDRLQKIAVQIGAFYWDVLNLGPLVISEEDMVSATCLIREMYEFLNMPVYGRLSGGNITINGESFHLHFTIPPCLGFDPRVTDWLEHMFAVNREMFFELPMMAHSTDIMPMMSKGDELSLPESPFLSVLEDLEIVKTQPILEYVYLAEEENRRKVRMLFRRSEPGLVRIKHIQVLKDIPYAFNFMFSVQNVGVANTPEY